MKTCTRCEIKKPLSEYYANKTNGSKDQLYSACKECIRATVRASRLRAKNPVSKKKKWKAKPAPLVLPGKRFQSGI